MKKLIVKLIGSFIMILVSIFAVAALIALIWGYCVPQGYVVGATTQKEMQEYLVAQMPELEGADASQVSFDMNGIYHVEYDGKTYIVNDANIQNNIGAFMKKYGDFDFRSKIAARSMMLTLVGAAFWSLSMTISLSKFSDYYREIRKEKKKVAKVVETAT